MTIELLAPLPLHDEITAVMDHSDNDLAWIVDWKTLRTRIAGPFDCSHDITAILKELRELQVLTRRLAS